VWRIALHSRVRGRGSVTISNIDNREKLTLSVDELRDSRAVRIVLDYFES
jgi:hypothetical protein